MCKPDVKARNKASKPIRLLASLDSFSEKHHHGEAPGLLSCILTGALVVATLTGMEWSFRYIFTSLQHLHPLLTNETNRNILARHVGVDAFSCAVAATMGWWSRHINKGVMDASFGGRPETMPRAGCEQRLFTYHPGGFRVSLFFFFYQVKNLYDTIVWGDGPEFIFHHVFSLVTAFGAMYPGCGHPYTIFFFGLSEISTACLCLLANFDDEHGVPGLGEALPLVKIGLGAVFIVLFIVCRCILWPIHSYYFCRDILQSLKGSDSRMLERRGWMKWFLVALSGISALQVAWLGQILLIAKEEVTKAGLF